MTREHIIDPTVTVLMETVGIHQDKIARAIRSFIAQDYDNAKLLVLNHHPSRLCIRGIPDHMKWRIEVLQVEDTFTRPIYQHMHNINQVRTDCWTILDDDDWIEPDHLSQLVEHWNTSADRNEFPLQVCGRNYLLHYEDGIKPLAFRGWHMSLFERLNEAEVHWSFKRFPQDKILGDDTWIAWNTYFDKREFEGKPTYHWDRIGPQHISSHETNRGETPKEKFDIALNYWRIKMEARASELKPVDLETE